MAEDAAQTIEDVTKWLVERNDHSPQAAAANVLELFGIALGAWVMADAAVAASHKSERDGASDYLSSKLKMVAFYAGHVFPKASMLKKKSLLTQTMKFWNSTRKTL